MLEVVAEKFDGAALERRIKQACGAESRDTPPQVEYLGTYLAHQELRAKTMLVESPYVDRHYLQEYVGF